MSAIKFPGHTLSREQLDSLQISLRRAVLQTCPSWLRDQVDDIVQTTTMKMIGRADKSGGMEKAGASYLRKVAYHAVVDEIRSRYRRNEVAMEDRPGIEQQIGSRIDPDRLARSRELDAGITDCLSRALQNRRRAVTLHLQGYSIPQVSSSLGWSKKKAEHLVARGISDLRLCLEKKGLAP